MPTSPFMYVSAGLGILLLALAGAFYLDHKELKSEIETRDTKITILSGQLEAEKESAAQFKASAATCSAGVDALKKAAQDAKDAAEKAKADLEAERKKQGRRVVMIASAPRPTGMTECEAANMEANNAIADRSASPFR